PIVIFLFPLALLAIQNPVIALVNQGKSGSFDGNLALNSTTKFTKKQPLKIAINDYYYGPQRDFEIWMPGAVIKNTHNSLMTINTTTRTVYMIFHKDIPVDTEMLNVVTKVYIFSYSSPIKGENVNIS
ncbi:MAG: hypothetical protein ACKO2Z_17350, partial [Sphaerospermopsis kisseleviana]